MTNLLPIPLNATLVISPKKLQLKETNALLQVSHELISETFILPLNLKPDQIQLLLGIVNQNIAIPSIFNNVSLMLKMAQVQIVDKKIMVKPDKFTKQEKLVLSGLRKGFSYKHIANNHFVSEHTIRSQVHSIYRKLGVHSRTEALNKVFGD
jgi:DNA-binding NarL/FixJ family response regulator